MRTNNMRKFVALFACLLCVGGVSAQSIKDIRINEVLVKNTDSYEDDYGHRSGWIELHNTGYSNVNVAGNYLTIRRGDKSVTYKIPKNDPRTAIPPQGYVVFFADGIGSKGTFYTNFTLDQTGEIYLLDASGRGPAVDSVKYSIADLKDDVSFGWIQESPNSGEVWKELPSTTPEATNNVIEFESRAELFRELDPVGIVMAITAMSVVFCALILLYLVFKRVGIVMKNRAARKENEAKGVTASVVETKKTMTEGPSGEMIAAIGIALRKYEDDLHDLESTVLTINRVARAYSPWSSKIYGLMQMPQRKK